MTSAPDRRRPRLGMTLVEAVVGMLVIAVAVGGALQATTIARLESVAADDRATALALLDAMRAQLAALRFADPTSGGTSLGVDAGESATGPSGWDDIDDADGWSGLPTVMSAGGGWSVKVTVTHAVAATPDSDSATGTGLKRVQLTALRGGRIILEEEYLRAAP